MYFINNLVNKINNQKSLTNYAEISLGITTGNNKVFIWSKKQINEQKFSEKEQNLFKPLVKGSSLTDVIEPSNPDSYVLYINKRIVESDIPGVVKWIRNNPLYPKLLKSRTGGNIRDIDLMRSREQWRFENELTIYFQKRSKTPRFTLNNHGYYIKDDAYCITLNNEYTTKPKYALAILTILNSTLTHFWLVKLGRKKGKTLELYPEVLRTVPIPDIVLIDENDITQINNAINNGTLLSLADTFVMKWFNLDSDDISTMKEYISNNQ